MSLLSSIASLLAGRRPDVVPPPAATDVSFEIVHLDPPDGSVLKTGDSITATIAWRYAAPAGRLGMWLKLDLPDADPDYVYEPDCDERQAGSGRLVRRVSLGRPGPVETLLLVAKDAQSREVRRVPVPVNYTFVPDAAHEQMRQDGQGSRILGIALDPPSPGRLAPGTPVDVVVECETRSERPMRASATPVTEAAMTFMGSVPLPPGRGTCDQRFIVGTPGVVRQLRVVLLNAAGAAVDERFFDVDLRYER